MNVCKYCIQLFLVRLQAYGWNGPVAHCLLLQSLINLHFQMLSNRLDSASHLPACFPSCKHPLFQ